MAVIVALYAGGCRERSTSPPAPVGGGELLAAASEASSVVVGTLDAVERIDDHAYAAVLEVERVLSGAGDGPRVRITWEELARGRAVRFREGDRLLVALAPLPDASIWDRRFPEARSGAGPLVVAAKGNGFIRYPRPVDVDLVGAYLSLTSAQRQTATGYVALARLIADAAGDLAASALRTLQSIVDDGRKLDSLSLQLLNRAVLDPGRPLELRSALISWAGDKGIEGMRPALDRLARPGNALDAEALLALGSMSGGFPQHQVEDLLDSPDARLRAVGARFARSSAMRDRLATLVQEDPAGEVRAAALTSVVAVGGIDAFEEIAIALGDADSRVRLSAVDAVGVLGAPATEPLEALAFHGTPAQATGAILALDRLGDVGKPILIRLSVEHSDAGVRRLALLAMGKMPEHH